MARIKNGRFVQLQNPPRLGIMFAAGEEESMVHVVDETGLTIDVVIVPNAQIERAQPNQARSFEITE